MICIEQHQATIPGVRSSENPHPSGSMDRPEFDTAKIPLSRATYARTNVEKLPITLAFLTTVLLRMKESWGYNAVVIWGYRSVSMAHPGESRGRKVTGLRGRRPYDSGVAGLDGRAPMDLMCVRFRFADGVVAPYSRRGYRDVHPALRRPEDDFAQVCGVRSCNAQSRHQVLPWQSCQVTTIGSLSSVGF